MPLFPQTSLDEITHVIQLAIAPVFLLTAVGMIISVLANRLARIVDRTRVLEERLVRLGADEKAPLLDELGLLDRRLKLVYIAVGCSVFCALFVGLLIVVAFLDAYWKANLARFVGLLFVLAMVAFLAALVVFLREIFLAVARYRGRTR